MEAAIEERERNGVFKSMEDFCARLDSRKVNKKVVESLVKCGAFDWTKIERAALGADIDATLAASASTQRDKASGQGGLFDTFVAAPAPKRTAMLTVPWTKAEKLGFEKELLGFYVTGHPLDEYRRDLESGKYVPINALGEAEDRGTVQVAGALISVEKKFTKKDSKPFAIVMLEDLTGSVEVRCGARHLPSTAGCWNWGRWSRSPRRWTSGKRPCGWRRRSSDAQPLGPSSNGNGNGHGGNGGHGSVAAKPVLLRFQRPSTTEAAAHGTAGDVGALPGAESRACGVCERGGKETADEAGGAVWGGSLPGVAVAVGGMAGVGDLFFGDPEKRKTPELFGLRRFFGSSG